MGAFSSCHFSSTFERFIMNKLSRVVVPASLLAVGSSAFAAVPAAVTTAVADIQTDAVAIATTVLIAIVAVFAIKFIRKGL